MKFIWVFVIAAMLSPALAHATPQPSAEAQVTSGADTHSIYIYNPPMSSRQKNYPLIIALHGDMGDWQQMQGMTEFDGLGQTEGFITVYPQANTEKDNKSDAAFNALNLPNLKLAKRQSWEDGRCCGRTLERSRDDVRFLDELIDILVRRYRADPSRIYMVGYDNGSELMFRYLCEYPDKIAAAAGVGGQEWYRDCKKAKRPVPILYFHGTKDPCFPYSGKGSCGACLEQYKGDAERMTLYTNRCAPVRSSLASWASDYECGSAPATQTHGSMTCETWQGCRGNSEVALCTVNGGGHTWPQGTIGLPDCERAGFKKRCQKLQDYLGSINQDVNATQMIWNFFKGYRR